MSSTIRIRNLPPDAETVSIKDLLTMVGDVYTIRVATIKGEKTAYVQMMSEMQASDCVDRFNKHRFRGYVLSVHGDKDDPKAVGLR
jgi:hypothetical protein